MKEIKHVGIVLIGIALVAVGFLGGLSGLFAVSDPCNSSTASQQCSKVLNYQPIIDYTAGQQQCMDPVPLSFGIYVNNVPQGVFVNNARSYFSVKSTSAASQSPNTALLTAPVNSVALPSLNSAIEVSSSSSSFAGNPFGSGNEICTFLYHIDFTVPQTSGNTSTSCITPIRACQYDTITDSNGCFVGCSVPPPISNSTSQGIMSSDILKYGGAALIVAGLIL